MQNPEFRQTLIFDMFESLHKQPTLIKAATVSPPLMRLPRGESVNLRPNDTGVVEIGLSRHSFQLQTMPKPVLLDNEDGEHALQFGRNVLGRHPDSDVILDATYRDVSRTHAIIEVRTDGTACITDLSSHGTFVDRNSVDTM